MWRGNSLQMWSRETVIQILSKQHGIAGKVLAVIVKMLALGEVNLYKALRDLLHISPARKAVLVSAKDFEPCPPFVRFWWILEKINFILFSVSPVSGEKKVAF